MRFKITKCIIIAILSACFCFADDKTLSEVVSEINTLNRQITIIKEQNEDKNGTSGDLKALESKKNALFEHIPFFITKSVNEVKDLQKEKKALEKKVNSYQSNSFKFASAKISLAALNLDEVFYGTMEKLAEAFKNADKPDKIKSILQEATTNLQVSDYQDIKNLRDALSDENRAELNLDFSNLEIQRQSYLNIFEYLAAHSDLLVGNFLFSSLNLKDLIDYINNLVPVNSNNFNSGKLILILMVFAFFLSLRRVLSKIVFKLFTAFLSKGKSNTHKAIQEQFISVIKRPISVFLIAYAIDVCLSIFFYPNLVPIKFVNYFSIIYVIIASWLILGILDGYGMVLLSKIAERSGRKEVVNLVIKILYFIVVVISILLILSKIGFDISTIIASLGIGGLAVALATKDIIANFFASILLLFDNSFSQGDWIVCAGVEGTVVEIGLRKTTIRTFDNALVFVPNSKIMSESVKNWNRRKIGRLIKMSIGLSYNCTKEQVEQCATEIKTMLIAHPGIAKSADSALNSGDYRLKYKQNMVSVDDLDGYKSNLFVSLDEFADSSINILVYCFSKTIVWGEFLALKQDIMLRIMEIVEKNGAGFAFPSQSLYVEKFPKIEFKQENSDVNSKVKKV